MQGIQITSTRVRVGSLSAVLCLFSGLEYQLHDIVISLKY